ncbi:ferredoxin-thioredoxin reductase/ variable chain [Synechococcus sp. A18-25c]|uniref:ferredoxin-thioredoxin reductase variable chain n=1 Tax=unclassified Synechococcus TaxID=2626047 RepID=UPI000C451C56|nr:MULTISPECIES: ferredoxin-thioredoxin reductase variable chain [unclassified Synechococcus]MAN18643.1 ferredoxin--nitrite reductase [Synechococcus sp. EAC657]MEC7249469.1 ferredoxin-thioredoxin reductase variable chain [Cyanobacteriota bacterium]MEC7897003.1 ferredoxin-thioredoxin reductase variable chain [Cyanobacteriota bacterium]MEC8096974.1 ferredoxin-thioredoxin reductase variable chain [Cyanobacteriota bacterium]QNI47492.1 ferredoxin-thioredoxin reductase/ variable chain [Synechococcus|tara:strand:- start:1801 stop:2022 length:222 start_codon:yes stop_codon:yes gene_type:complete
MQPGDKVVVTSSVIVYNHPQHRGEAFDMKGSEGDVVNVLSEWKGRPISPTLPVIVAFGRYKAHFRDDELQSAS